MRTKKLYLIVLLLVMVGIIGIGGMAWAQTFGVARDCKPGYLQFKNGECIRTGCPEDVIRSNHFGWPLDCSSDDCEGNCKYCTGSESTNWCQVPQGPSFHSDYGVNDRYQLITFLTDYADNMIINEIATTSDKIKAEILNDNGVLLCRVSLNPDCPEGNWAERVTIHARINEWDKAISIPVNLMIYK